MSTTSARVRCPHCGKSFKIPDRALLGRTGKCSACAQRFTLTEEGAAPAAGDASSASQKTKAPESPGREAVNPISSKPSASEATDSGIVTPKKSPSEQRSTSKANPPAGRPVGQEAVRPTPKQPMPGGGGGEKRPAPVAATPEADIPFALNAKWIPDDEPKAEVQNPVFSPFEESNPFGSLDDSSSATPAPAARTGRPAVEGRRGKSKQRGQRKWWIGAAAAVVLVGASVAVFVLSRDSANLVGSGATAPPVQPETSLVPAAYTREMLKGNLGLIDEFRPTHGKPIGMQYVPDGVNLVVHLRPAELWGSDRAAAELRGSLTEGVTNWLESRIKDLCRREPARVSEATFAFVLGAFGTEPTSTQVVRLSEPARISVLLDEFRGKTLQDDLKPQVTIADPFAYVLVDASTFAISPAATADELKESLNAPNTYVSKNVSALLRQTDRDRLLTVVAELQDLRRHVDTLFLEPVRPAVHAVLDWLGDDVDAIAWSVHTKPFLYSELVLRPRVGVSPRALEAAFQKKLEELPNSMVNLVKGTHPVSKGFRDLVGRYPAMLEAVSQSTVLRPEMKDLEVHAITVLPGKAAPNLALGTLLTWDELRKTPAGGSAAIASKAEPTESVADRLKKEILAEFSRMPLEQAVKYIGDETGVDFSVDGEALRMTGYTRNMPQTMSLGKVPATRALKEMLSVPNQKDLAVFVDEKANKAVMSTAPYLQQQGKTKFEVE